MSGIGLKDLAEDVATIKPLFIACFFQETELISLSFQISILLAEFFNQLLNRPDQNFRLCATIVLFTQVDLILKFFIIISFSIRKFLIPYHKL